MDEVPGNRTSWTGRQLQKMILGGLRKARHVICVSEATRKELIRMDGLSEHRVSLIYNGLNYSYAPCRQRQRRLRFRQILQPANHSFCMSAETNGTRIDLVF